MSRGQNPAVEYTLEQGPRLLLCRAVVSAVCFCVARWVLAVAGTQADDD